MTTTAEERAHNSSYATAAALMAEVMNLWETRFEFSVWMALHSDGFNGYAGFYEAVGELAHKLELAPQSGEEWGGDPWDWYTTLEHTAEYIKTHGPDITRLTQADVRAFLQT